MIKVKNIRETKLNADRGDSLLKSLNNLFDNSSLTKDGKFDVSSFIKKHQDLKDSIKNYEWHLDFIRHTYGFTVRQKVSGGINNITIHGGDNIDSVSIIALF